MLQKDHFIKKGTLIDDSLKSFQRGILRGDEFNPISLFSHKKDLL
jgi:hypothetical protein